MASAQLVHSLFSPWDSHNLITIVETKDTAHWARKPITEAQPSAILNPLPTSSKAHESTAKKKGKERIYDAAEKSTLICGNVSDFSRSINHKT
jgi:hypothetical protein